MTTDEISIRNDVDILSVLLDAAANAIGRRMLVTAAGARAVYVRSDADELTLMAVAVCAQSERSNVMVQSLLELRPYMPERVVVLLLLTTLAIFCPRLQCDKCSADGFSR
jgi:hypothetical protein